MGTLLILPVIMLVAGLVIAAWGWLNDDQIRHQRGY